MASLDSLAADQRAVLALVLQRSRSYDEIAGLLSIDRAAVRRRALAAADALAPDTEVPRERRALISDYLLGQLPSRVAEEIAARLKQSPAERAWAARVATELAPLASHPLPELPPEPQSATVEAAAPAVTLEPEVAARRVLAGSAVIPAQPGSPASAARGSATGRIGLRRGGIVLIVLAVVALAAVLLVFVLFDSSGKKHGAAPPGTVATPTSVSAPAGVQVLGEINLTSPTAPSTVGIAQVLRQGSTSGIVIRAQNVPPNTRHDAYAVWLYNSAGDAHLLGFVSRQVGSDGTLSTTGPLPPNLRHYKELIVTREKLRNPKQPGKIVLRGRLNGIS